MRKNELLVPASSLEVLKIAVIYGADSEPKPKILPWKRWQRELHLHMHGELKFM